MNTSDQNLRKVLGNVKIEQQQSKIKGQEVKEGQMMMSMIQDLTEKKNREVKLEIEENKRGEKSVREENKKEATKREKRTKIRQKQLKRSSSKIWSNNAQNTRKTDPRDNGEVTNSTRPIDQRKIHEN